MRLGGKALVGLMVAGSLTAAPLSAAAASLDAPSPPILRPSAEEAGSPVPTPAVTALTPDAHYVLRWALESGDSQHQPFAVVDKKAARIHVFDAEGHLVGSANALLGLAPGDQSTPPLSDGEIERLPAAERTTPAGRFASQPGRNLSGEAVVWFDYGAGLAIHRVRAGASQSQRLERLASATAGDNRASLGCVVVAPAFFDAVVQPLLGQRRGVVYVLPERQPVQAMFGRLQAPLAQQR